ncbi:MAG: hypothetical protein HKN78_03615 [Sphingomonadaceae bacterium]|nr:hypothetical protein [Sphingomonadaceae bacterium]
MTKLLKIALFTASAGLIATPGQSQTEEDMAIPQVYSDLIACRSVTDDAARLACYDQHVATMQAQADDESILVVDREEVRQAERGLFGLRLPRLGRLFGGSEENRVNAIESTITAVAGGQRGRGWRFRLEDGSLWVQTDMRDQLSRDPRVGHSVIIERAALGSFRAEIDGMRLIRVQRVE